MTQSVIMGIRQEISPLHRDTSHSLSMTSTTRCFCRWIGISM